MVLEALQHRSIDKYICLGDIVGYGPQPNECIDLIREKCEITILGNHDNMAIGREKSEHFNSHALKAIEWTQNVLTEENAAFLKKLPYLYKNEQFQFVHASPKSPADWYYLSHLDDSVDAFEYFEEPICFIGHTHCPSIVIQNGSSYHVKEEPYHQLQFGERMIVNVGSVGQPRDRDNRASFCIFDSDSWTVDLIRIPYDFYETQSKIRESRLPEFLAQRLSEGR